MFDAGTLFISTYGRALFFPVIPKEHLWGFRCLTCVKSFAVGEEGELEEQGAQQIRSTHYASHLKDQIR